MTRAHGSRCTTRTPPRRAPPSAARRAAAPAGRRAGGRPRAARSVLTGGTHRRRGCTASWPGSPGPDASTGRGSDVWWGDERFFGPGYPERNETRPGRRCSTRSAPTRRVHAMPATDGRGDDPDAGAAAYAAELRRGPPGTARAEFDVVMLGVGPDGHVASLFPGHPALDVEDRIAVGVTGSPKPPPERITPDPAALQRPARCGSWSAARTRPAPSPRRSAGPAPRHPGRRRRGPDATLWLLDRAAASALSVPVPVNRKSHFHGIPARPGPPAVAPCSAAGSSEDDLAGLAAGAEQLEGLVEDVLRLGVGAPLLHVREVGLVGLDLRRRRRVLGPGWPGGRTAGSPTSPGSAPRPTKSRPSRCSCEQK